MDKEDDYDIDDILDSFSKKKKKKKSGDKGKRGERGLIEKLEIRFPGKPFSRTLGSGNRWSQVRLTETAKKVFTGDLITPDDFLFALECKNGYNEINLELAVKRIVKNGKGNKQLDKFLTQVRKDGERVNKIPLMCWKKDYKPWLAFLETRNLPPQLKEIPERFEYREWSVLSLEKVLEMPDSFFFKGQ